jgi:hypothetical protein
MQLKAASLEIAAIRPMIKLHLGLSFAIDLPQQSAELGTCKFFMLIPTCQYRCTPGAAFLMSGQDYRG